jgi:2-polyprenyl-3-methyl-5-hydroxy-6-metoxy-1,4-benzoquinol methylase
VTRPAARYGFRIDDYLDLHGWQVIELGGVPSAAVPACPADGTPLKTLCTLTSAVDHIRVRIGCCAECGHITYIDRPTQEWIYRYYLETWDSAATRATPERRAAVLEKLARADQATEHATVRLARELPVDRSLPVCEIGCGFGVSLRQLAASGFVRLVGIEASRHRGDIARSGGFDVLTTPFESPETRDALRARGPFGLILTFHALEHTYHPDAIFAAASALQEPGGHLVVSVPNQEGEPSMGVLLFLPHLHSFTSTSLARLAARYGYEIADARASSAKNLNVAFRRTASATPVAAAPDAYGPALEKLVTGLELDRPHIGRRRLWWSRRSDIAGQVWVGPPALWGRRNWKRFVDRSRIDRPRSVLVTNLRADGGPPNESPVEIQFRGPVGLFFK